MEEQHERHVDNDLERTPLLDVASRATERPSPVASVANTLMVQPQTGHKIVNLLCAIIFVAASSAGFSQIPLVSLVEDAFCRQYYGGRAQYVPIDEDLCKVDYIQSNVAFTFAVSGALDAVVGFLAAVPWGIAADRYFPRHAYYPCDG